MTSLRWITTGFALCLALIGIGLIAYSFMDKPEPAVLAKPAPELEGETTTTLACKPVVIYRDKVAKELGVPTAPNRHVVAATNIAASDHPYTVTAQYDDQTGIVSQYVRRDPLPWLAFDQSKELSLSYGYRQGLTESVARLGGRWDVASVKAVRFGVLADVDSGGWWFAGVGVRVRF